AAGQQHPAKRRGPARRALHDDRARHDRVRGDLQRSGDLRRAVDRAPRLAARRRLSDFRIRLPRRQRSDSRIHNLLARRARAAQSGTGPMNRSISFRIALACTALALPAAASAELTGPVRTEQGLVQGAPSKVEGVTVFKGIPFAAPPVGELRWKQPQPPASWEGVRDATEYGDVCVQNPAPQRFPPNAATDTENFTGMSEDCLNLNIWT